MSPYANPLYALPPQIVIDIGRGYRYGTAMMSGALGFFLVSLPVVLGAMTFKAQWPWSTAFVLPTTVLLPLIGALFWWIWRRRAPLHSEKLAFSREGVTWENSTHRELVDWRELAMVAPAEKVSSPRKREGSVYVLLRPAQPPQFWQRHPQLAHFHHSWNVVVEVNKFVYSPWKLALAVQSWAPHLWNPGVQEPLRRGLQLTPDQLPKPR